MIERDATVDTVEELHEFVHQELCATENLLAEQFTTRSQLLFVKSQLCAIQYSLLGLRSIRLGAIWAADQNVIYFYNARGERVIKVRLTKRIPMEQLAAAFQPASPEQSAEGSEPVAQSA